MSVRQKAAPHMLYAMQQQQQKQLWPSSPIGQAPVKGRARYSEDLLYWYKSMKTDTEDAGRSWVTAANGDMVPGPAAMRHMQVAFYPYKSTCAATRKSTNTD